jgi:hypothetical protein
MPMKNKILVAIVAVAVLSMVFSGCVAFVAGAAGGAGGYAWASGKLSFTTEHSIGESHDATVAALKDLDIAITGDQTDKLAGKVKGVTPTNDAVTVDLEPQASNITKIDIRVGFWGNKAESTKIADAIKRHL